MNILHVVAVGKDELYNLELIFDNEGQIKSELVYRTSAIEAIPHYIVPGNMLDAWQASNKTLRAAKEIFYHRCFSKNKTIFLKPLEFKREANHKITGGDYSIFTSDLGIIVNYKPGGFKEFKRLHEALNWITEEHYPAQQIKQLSKIIDSIV